MKTHNLLFLFIFVLIGCSSCNPFIGKTLIEDDYPNFYQASPGHHTVEYDDFTLDYDWEVDTKNSEIYFTGTCLFDGHLKAIAADTTWKDITVNFQLLFLDKDYKVINVGYMSVFLGNEGFDLMNEFNKNFDYHPNMKYVYWYWSWEATHF